MIRDATVKDIKNLISFLNELHDISGYSDIKVQEKVTEQNLQIMLSTPMHKIWVAEKDSKICGALGVVSQQLWFCKRHYTTNLFFCVNNQGKGSGAFLLRRFKRWVDSRPIIKDVTLSITSEIKDKNRVGKLYQAVGFKEIGGIFRL